MAFRPRLQYSHFTRVDWRASIGTIVCLARL
jgi:hypothetical protein